MCILRTYCCPGNVLILYNILKYFAVTGLQKSPFFHRILQGKSRNV